MENREMQKLTPDNPLSITDGAPRVIDIAGQPARIPAGMDYRILARIAEVEKLDAEDQTFILLYCAFHATPKQIAALWKDARSPKKLYEKITLWTARVPVELLSTALEEIAAFDNELAEEGALDADDGELAGGNPGKKKTSSR